MFCSLSSTLQLVSLKQLLRSLSCEFYAGLEPLDPYR